MSIRIAYCIALALLLVVSAQPLEARSRSKKRSGQNKGATVQAVESFSGKVVRVSDGDTCDVEVDGGKTVRVRIYGIDAPELAQSFGKEARKYLDQRIFRQMVTVEKFYDDQYGRCVGRILLDGQDLALELLREGIVWHYVQYSFDQSYSIAERLARERRKGLWAEMPKGSSEPVAPWEYRKAHPRRGN
ncbi:MAG: thermonuclease family protein [Victivallales bacterium]|nr:thermonuclease family protein [Victivallales bacterium]